MLSTHQKTSKTLATKLVDVSISGMYLKMLVDMKSDRISRRDCKDWSWRDKRENVRRSLRAKNLKNVSSKKKKL